MSQGNYLVGTVLLVIALGLIIVGVLNNLRIVPLSKPTDSTWLVSASLYVLAIFVAWFGHWQAYPHVYK